LIDIALSKTLSGATGHLQLELQTRIEHGSFITLFGPSGAGKTTILRMLAGLAEPDGGKITVDGATWLDTANKINLPPQRRSIGFVFQDYALFPNLSVRGNVGYAVAKDDVAWIDELLELIGLTALQNRLPATLSGGQKQRVALARALARKPALLLLDEPLSALDADLRSQLQDELAYLHQRLGLTTVLVSHDVGEVFKLSQRVLRLEQGRVSQAGTPAEIFLQQRVAGRLNLRAQILAIRREDVVYILSLLLGQEIVDVIATDDEVEGMRVGDIVSVSAKAFGAIVTSKGRLAVGQRPASTIRVI
jgi:molybdate transport system ATP-binding protein